MEIKETPGKFKKYDFIKEECLKRQFQFEVEILSHEEITSYKNLSPIPRYVCLAMTEAEQFEHECEPPETLKKLKEAFKKFKAEQPKTYQYITMQFALKKFAELEKGNVDPQKSIWIRATARAQIKGKLCALTRYLCRINADDGLSKMLTNSKVMLMQQDVHLIEDTLQESAEIFACAVKWEKEKDSRQELKDQMSLLMFLLSHNMRDIRGTASGNEWLESPIYSALDVPFSTAADCMVDLESFANPLFSDFRKAYDRIVTFEDSNCTSS
jgi:hypothetical protein